jgi:hypothetical protein
VKSIYRTPWEIHIDLDQLQMVGPPYYLNRMGHGGLYVGVWLRFALQDKPYVYERPLRDKLGEVRFTMNPIGVHEVQLIDGTWIDYSRVVSGNSTLAIKNLSKDTNEILKAWYDWKSFKHVGPKSDWAVMHRTLMQAQRELESGGARRTWLDAPIEIALEYATRVV